MDSVDNNQFEVVPAKSKRKIVPPCSNVYLNPALDLLANEDPMCNTAMEIVPVKKRKRSRSCDIVAFENSALDLGISKSAVNEFLAKELENVRKNIRSDYCDVSANISIPKTSVSEPNIRTFDLNASTDSKIGNFCFKSNISEPVKYFIGSDVCDMDLQPNIQESEPNYANLDTILPKSSVTNLTMDETNDGEAQNMFNNATNVSVNDQSNTFISHGNFDDSVSIENCMDIAKTNNTDTDSGISIIDQKYTTTSLENNNLSAINNINIQTNLSNQIFVNNPNLSLSFINRLALDSPNISNQSLVFDDDLNESNIMEIKTITIMTKKKRIEPDKTINTNPFLDPNLNLELEETASTATENPFLDTVEPPAEMEYNHEMINRPIQGSSVPINPLMPRRLFTDNNSTISTVNDTIDQHEYENIDGYRSESPVYENVTEMCEMYNKQSKILGCDVSQFSKREIMNLKKHAQVNSSNESNDSKKDLKHSILKVSNKLSKKVLKTLKKTFKGEKHSAVEHDTTLNPYEVPRKPPKDKVVTPKDSGIENPGLDTSDIEIEELDEFDDDEEHQYETIKTLRNTRLNMNVTPLRERTSDNVDVSHNKTNTPGKKVRFDSTLNQEKIITGNSFDYGLQSPGFDVKIDKYHDELENCINEKKILQQNM